MFSLSLKSELNPYNISITIITHNNNNNSKYIQGSKSSAAPRIPSFQHSILAQIPVRIPDISSFLHSRASDHSQFPAHTTTAGKPAAPIATSIHSGQHFPLLRSRVTPRDCLSQPLSPLKTTFPVSSPLCFSSLLLSLNLSLLSIKQYKLFALFSDRTSLELVIPLVSLAHSESLYTPTYTEASHIPRWAYLLVKCRLTRFGGDP